MVRLAAVAVTAPNYSTLSQPLFHIFASPTKQRLKANGEGMKEQPNEGEHIKIQ